MWETDYTRDTDRAPDTVWRALRALQTGQVPLSNGDRRHLTGQFAVGGTVTVSAAGVGTLESTITELTEGQLLAEQTRFGELILLLRHTLHPLDGGGTRITRQLQINGDKADIEGPVAGPRISEDYPEALQEIIALAHTSPP
ncbi:MAG: polyketide cyclase [Actinomycetota bacterium]|nr:polyketide cyclase [Actinomycetota bacterium]